MPRGFLPWGLSNTCPQDGGVRASVACDGQVSDNPKHFLSFTEVSFWAGHLQKWLTLVLRPKSEQHRYDLPSCGPSEQRRRAAGGPEFSGTSQHAKCQLLHARQLEQVDAVLQCC